MSEFTDLLLLLWRVVRLVVDAILYLLAGCLLVLACIMPTRWSHIVKCMFKDGDFWESFRCQSVFHFFMTLLDIFLLPLGLVSAVVPSRTYTFFADSYLLIQNHVRDHSDDCEWNWELRYFWWCNFWCAIFEAILLIWCVPSFVVPTRLVTFVRTSWMWREQLRWESGKSREHDESLHALWFMSPIMAFIEIIGFIAGMLVLVTLIRSCQTFRDIQAGLKQEMKERNNVIRFLFSYRMQWALVLNAVSVIVDIVFLPLVILLTVTLWRLPPVLAQLKRGFDWKARWAILKHSAFLVLDVLLLAPLLLVLFTMYRSKPVYEVFRRFVRIPAPDSEKVDEKCCGGFDWRARSVILKQSMYLFLDLLLSLPLLLVLFTGYRAKPVCEVFCNSMKHLMDPETTADDELCAAVPTDVHKAILRASGLLCLDLLCMPFVLVISLVTFYRLPALVRGISPGLDFHKTVMQQSCQLLIDMPFLFAGLIVFCTIYRTDLLLPVLDPRAKVDAWDRRKAVGEQLLFILVDVVCLLPLMVVLVTVYRVPSMLLKLKARFSRPLVGAPDMQPVELQLLAPRSVGKLGIRVVARKSPNLSGVHGVKVRVLGRGFWDAVAVAHGQMIATIGQGVLPLALKQGRDIDCNAIEYGRDQVELKMEFNYQIATDAVLSYLDSLPRDTQAMLQVEAKLTAGRDVILLTLASTIGALRDCLASDTGSFPPGALLDDAGVHFLREGGCMLRRNAWQPVVLDEVVQVAIDLSHVLLALVLLLVPWRCIKAVGLATERLERRPARHAARAVAALGLWERRCGKAFVQAEQLAIDYAKAAVIPTKTAQAPQRAKGWGRHGEDTDRWEKQMEACIGCFCCLFCPCCPNYVDFDPFGESPLQLGRNGRQKASRTLDQRLQVLSAKMELPSLQLRVAVKMWWMEQSKAMRPDGPDWNGFLVDIDEQLALRSESFFWLLLLSEVHLLLADSRLHPDEHADLVELIRARALRLVTKQAEHQQQLLTRFRNQHALAFGLRGWQFNSWSLARSIIREQLLKGISELLLLPGLVLLVITFYRLPRLCMELRGRCDAEWFKVMVVHELKGLCSDIFVLLQFLLLTSLLICTVLKLPDFIAGLRPAKGLRANRNWALLVMSELAVGFLELLLLLTAWKTYRVFASALLFSVLSPAAMLALALPSLCPQRIRFGLASLIWGALIAGCLATLGPVAQIVSGGFLALSCMGLCCQRKEGWVSRHDDDWWSPVARCTLPNLLVLAAIGAEAALLAFAADRWAADRASEDTPHMPQAYVIAALVIASLHLFLSAVPLVSDEEERKATVQDPAWRAAISVLQDVFFPFVAFALAPEAATTWWQGLVLLYFVAISALNGATWEECVPHSMLLDIRHFEVFSSVNRLLVCAAMLASARQQRIAFVVFVALLGIWTAVSILWKAASVLWVQILRFGICVGALISTFAGFEKSCLAWVAVALVAFLVAFCARVRRRWQLAATDVPAAMVRLSRIQMRLSLWSDLEEHPAHSTQLPAMSPQGVAQQLISLEGHVPFERLRLPFLRRRHDWHQKLLQAPHYKAVMSCLEELEAAVMVPPDRELLLQLLRKVPLTGRRTMPRTLVAEIVSYVDAGRCRCSQEIVAPQIYTSWQDACPRLQQAHRSASQAAQQLLAPGRKSGPCNSGGKRMGSRNSRSDRVHPAEMYGRPSQQQLPSIRDVRLSQEIL